MRGAPVNSEERKAARRARREAERARKRERRLRDCTLENVADLENLYDAAMKAKKGIAWKASTQRYHKDLMLNLSKARSDLMEGRDIRRGFHHFTLYERGKLRRKVAEGKMTREQALRSYQSWRGSIVKLDAHRTLLEMDALCKALFGDDAEDLRGGGLTAETLERMALALAA